MSNNELNDFLVDKEFVDTGNKVADHMILKIYETMKQIHDDFEDEPLLRAIEASIYSSEPGKKIIEKNNGERIPITMFNMLSIRENEDDNASEDALRIQFNNPLFMSALDISATGDILWTMVGDEMSICPHRVISQQMFGVAMFSEFNNEEDAGRINHWLDDMFEVVYVQYRRMLGATTANGFVDWNLPETKHLIELEKQMKVTMPVMPLDDIAEEKLHQQKHSDE